MILIDEHVESRLAEALEVLKADPKTSRCIFFTMGSPVTNDFKEKLFGPKLFFSKKSIGKWFYFALSRR